MGLKKKERAILSSKAVRDELLHSLVIDEVLPRMTFLTKDDIQTIKAEPRNDNRMIELSNLLEKKLSKLTPFVEVLSQFGDTYINLITLLKGHGLSRTETYVYGKFSSKEREPKNMDPENIVSQAVLEHMPIYFVQPFIFYIAPFRIVLFANHPDLERFDFEKLAISKLKHFRRILVSDIVLRDFFDRSSIQILFKKNIRPLYIAVTQYSQKDLHWFDVYETDSERQNLDELSLCLKGGADQPLQLAPIVKAVSKKFIFSNINCHSLDNSKVYDLENILKWCGSPQNIESIRFSKMALTYDEEEEVGDADEVETEEKTWKIFRGYKKLRSLTLNELDISVRLLCQLTAALKSGVRKCELTVSNVRCLQEPGAFDRFCEALKGNEVISSLSLSENGLSEEQLAPLFHTLPSMTNIRDIDLDGNEVSQPFCKDLGRLLVASSVDKVLSF